MHDPRIDKLANVLVNYSTAIQPGQKVVVNGSALAAPLIKAVYKHVLQAGGLPFVMVALPGMEEVFYHYASEAQLQHVPDPVKQIFQTYDAYISVSAAENTKDLSAVDPGKVALRNRAQGELFSVFIQRAAAGEMHWVGTLFPTAAYAQDAEMSLSDYEDFVFDACLPDLDDPVGYWRRFQAWQQKIVDWLKGKDKVHVIGPETDLHLSVAGRTFINCSGQENMPDGEVFTGPVEDSVNGHVYFSYPAIYQGREVTGVRLWFENGKVVKATAAKNEDLLISTLDTDPGARTLGEFAIGTNEGIQRFTRQILFDEKIGGSFHMAVGAGFPESGSKNESSVHWDMICDLRQGGEIWVDDELLYKDGKFVVEF